MSDGAAISGPAVAATTAPPSRHPDSPAAERGADPPDEVPGSHQKHPASAADPLPSSVRELLGFLQRRITGNYGIDEFGFDPELTDTLVLPPLRLLFDKWFRVRTQGAGNLPSTGGALVVCNHSGTLPLDALMTAVAVHGVHEQPRHLRMLGADLVFRTPFVGEFARKTGQTLACDGDAQRLLRAGELVGVWPEGFKGIGKPFGARYKLQRFGRGGFVS